ncbi:hypothetical protein B9Z55_009295 [Caenorhabditis nigoni]|nr:hypothetical protein B9Z55_009295 [Caenorhabditis nigoni]
MLGLRDQLRGLRGLLPTQTPGLARFESGPSYAAEKREKLVEFRIAPPSRTLRTLSGLTGFTRNKMKGTSSLLLGFSCLKAGMLRAGSRGFKDFKDRWLRGLEQLRETRTTRTRVEGCTV